MNFFSPDSKFAQVMTSVGEMMLLNLCWILASLPLVTIGAANAAMYTILGRRLRNEDNGTVIPFFKAWFHNLKQGSLFWMAQIFVTVSLGSFFFLPLPSFAKVVAAVFLILVTLVFSIIYPQIARFRNRWLACIKNALILLTANPGRVLGNVLLFLSPVLVFALTPDLFLRLGFIWILFGFSGLFYLSARIMQKVMQPLEELSESQKPQIKITY